MRRPDPEAIRRLDALHRRAHAQGVNPAAAFQMTTRRYVYAGHDLVSGLLLPELGTARSANGAPDFTIALQPETVPATDIAWLHHWMDGDVCELSLARATDGYLLRFPDLADVVVCGNGEARVTGLPGVSARTLRHLLLDQVLPRMLAQRGDLVLHASAASVSDSAAIVILGPSGHGKSTLAAGLATQSGGDVLADDCVVATIDGDRLLAVPSYSGLRLWPDSLTALFEDKQHARRVNDYSDKRRIAVADSSRSAWPIAAILVLGHVELEHGESGDSGIETRMTALGASDACMALVGNSFQLDVSDTQQVHRLLGLAADAAQLVPVLSLRYRRDFAMLPQVARAILEHPLLAQRR